MAVDPGGTSGLAVRSPDGRLTTYSVQTSQQLWDWFLPGEPKFDHVIVEEWTFRTGEAVPTGVMTSNIVASLVGICYVNAIPLSIRTPGSRYGKMDEATKWYKVTRRKSTTNKSDSHEIDALAHLLTWERLNVRT